MNKNFVFYAETHLAKSSDHSIEKILEKREIVYPNNELAIFKTVYAKIEEPNGNGVRLGREAVLKALPTLVGKQVNLNHWRYGFIVGHILDAWLNKNDEIEIAYTFCKDIYKEEYKESLEKMADGKLAVSFELTTDLETAEKLEDGTIRLHDIIFTGVGHLINKKPAYSSAIVYQQACEILKRVEDNPNLIFASEIKEQCNKIIADTNLQNNEQKGGRKDMTDEQNKKIEALKAEFKDAVKDWKDEDFLNDQKVEELRASLKPASAAEATVPATEAKNVEAENVVAESKSLSIEKYITLTTYKDDGTVETNYKKECTYAWKDSEGKTQTETISSDTTAVTSYSEAQVAEKVAEAKAPIEKSVKDLSAENESLKAKVAEFEAKEATQKEAEKAKKIAAVKEELKDNLHAKDFKDEDYLNAEKVAQVKILKENEDLKAEIAALKAAPSATPVTVQASETAVEAAEKVTGHAEVTVDKRKEAKAILRKYGTAEKK